MIPEKDFMRYEKQTSKLYEELELQLIQDIAERIANVGELNTVGYNNTEILQEMGYLYDDIINDVAKFNNMNSAEVKAIFEKAGIKSIKKDDIIYKQAGISPGKISDTLVNIMERQADTTNYNILRLTRTTAMTGQNQFINAINQAYLETSSGMKSYSQSIIDAVNQVSKTGAIVQYPTGTIRSLESAVRMNVLTSIGQMSGELQLERAKEVGWDLVEVSAHIGARPEHAEWQGKVYSLTGSNGYKNFYKETGYGDMLGLCGINCRHTFYPFYKGSTTTYTKSELEEMKNAKVYYNGKEMSYYDATQLQRRMERTIRQNRKNIAGLNGLQNSDVDNQDLKLELQKAKDKLTRNQNTLSDFIQQTGFKDNDRTYVGSGKAVVKKEIKEVKKIENKTKSNIQDNIVGIDNKLHTQTINRLDELSNKYPNMSSFFEERKTTISTDRLPVTTDAQLGYNVKMTRVNFEVNRLSFQDYDSALEEMKHSQMTKFHMPCDEKYYDVYVITHEYGHAVECYLINEYNLTHPNEMLELAEKEKKYLEAIEPKKSIAMYDRHNNKIAKNIAKDILELAKKENPNFQLSENLSKYGKTNVYEFFAECFANANCGKPNELGKAMQKYLKSKGL